MVTGENDERKINLKNFPFSVVGFPLLSIPPLSLFPRARGFSFLQKNAHALPRVLSQKNMVSTSSFLSPLSSLEKNSIIRPLPAAKPLAHVALELSHVGGRQRAEALLGSYPAPILPLLLLRVVVVLLLPLVVLPMLLLGWSSCSPARPHNMHLPSPAQSDWVGPNTPFEGPRLELIVCTSS